MPEPSTFKPVTDTMKQAVRDISSQMISLGNDVTSKIRGIMDEEMSEVIDLGENILNRANTIIAPFIASMYNWMKGLPKVFSKTGEYLKGLFSIELWRQKRERMTQGLKESSILDAIMKGLGMAFLGLGILIGPWLKKIIQPFKLLAGLTKGFQTSKMYKAFTSFLQGKNPVILWFTKWISKFANSKLVKSLMKAINFVKNSRLMKLFKFGLRKGMKYLFWPLQILISTMEFIKGFMSTKGDIFDKVAGGLKKVLNEFFGFPFKVIGMLVDWVAEKFSIENLGAEKFFEDAFKMVTDTLFAVPLAIKDGIKWIFTDGIDLAKDYWKKIDFGEIFAFDKIFEIFATVKTAITEWLYKVLDSKAVRFVFGGFEGYQSLMGDLKQDIDAAKDLDETKKMKEEELKLMRANNASLEEIKRKQMGNTSVSTINQNQRGGGQLTPDMVTSSRDIAWAGTFE